MGSQSGKGRIKGHQIAEFLPPSESVNAVNAVTPQDDQPPANNDEEIPF
jgi:hypothetical protein